MSRESHLKILRENNNGYNPEKIEDAPWLKIKEVKRNCLVLLNRDTGEEEIWTKSTAANEAEYIEKWPRQYALEYKGRFYYRAS